MKDKRGIRTEKELRDVLKRIPVSDKAHRNRIVCSLIGHSRISDVCWGYRTCGRCGDQLGDSLGSIDPGRETAVIISHDPFCETCRENYKKCTWKDKIFVKNPFTKKERTKKKYERMVDGAEEER